MGQEITYEIGKLNPGRRVKVFDAYGGGGHAHGKPGTLKSAEPKYAVFQPDGHNGPVQVEWKRVRDWTSHNNLPLIMPPLKAKPMNGTTSSHPTLPPPQPVQIPVAAIAQAAQSSPFDVYANLSSAAQQAAADIHAAEEMLDEALERVTECRRVHDEAVAKLSKIRQQAADALKSLDSMLAGTTAAQR